jgi:hypothetical protein
MPGRARQVHKAVSAGVLRPEHVPGVVLVEPMATLRDLLTYLTTRMADVAMRMAQHASQQASKGSGSGSGGKDGGSSRLEPSDRDRERERERERRKEAALASGGGSSSGRAPAGYGGYAYPGPSSSSPRCVSLCVCVARLALRPCDHCGAIAVDGALVRVVLTHVPDR